MAGTTAGLWSSVEEAAACIGQTTVAQPDRWRAGVYRELFDVYRSLYPELERSFRRLAVIGPARV